MLAISSSRPTGFSMKSDAPAFMARTAIATSLLPVIMMAGRRWPSSRSFSSNSRPLIPGRYASINRHAGLSGLYAFRNASQMG